MSLRDELKQEYGPVPQSWKPQAEGAGAIVVGKLVKVERTEKEQARKDRVPRRAGAP